MAVSASLAAGEHVLFADPAFHWEAAVSDTSPPRVILTASMRVAADAATPAQERSTATVAIQMEGQVALQLYGKLYALVRAQGWLPEE